MSTPKRGDKVEEITSRGPGRKGEVIEVDTARGRARVNWEGLGRNLRTWIRFAALRAAGGERFKNPKPAPPAPAPKTTGDYVKDSLDPASENYVPLGAYEDERSPAP